MQIDSEILSGLHIMYGTGTADEMFKVLFDILSSPKQTPIDRLIFLLLETQGREIGPFYQKIKDKIFENALLIDLIPVKDHEQAEKIKKKIQQSVQPEFQHFYEHLIAEQQKVNRLNGKKLLNKLSSNPSMKQGQPDQQQKNDLKEYLFFLRIHANSEDLAEIQQVVKRIEQQLS